MADGATVKGIGATRKSGGAPYPGTRPFLQADQDRFFGRGTDSKALLELWQDNRLTLLVGPVASGKTSLLNAGVLPFLKQNRTYFPPIGRISCGSTFPRAALPEHNPYTLALLQSWSPGVTITQLVDLTVRDFIRVEADRQRGQYGGPLLAAIDQVDDLLTDPGQRRAHREKFLGELADAVRDKSGLHLLLVAREETAALISEALGGAAVFNLAALTRQDAIDAVTGPVAGPGALSPMARRRSSSRTYRPGSSRGWTGRSGLSSATRSNRHCCRSCARSFGTRFPRTPGRSRYAMYACSGMLTRRWQRIAAGSSPRSPTITTCG